LRAAGSDATKRTVILRRVAGTVGYLLLVGGLAGGVASANPKAAELRLSLAGWRIIERESGRTNYYKVFKDEDPPFIRALYRPAYETAVLGFKIPDASRSGAKKLRWSWRALTLPQGGDECAADKHDSAAVIYVSWRRGLRWYVLKYVWSAVGTKGAVCGRKRNPLVAQDTVVLESGGPVNTWKTESLDLRAEFRKHFADGDASAVVPDLLGIGIMTDGDQTHSDSAADFAEFVITL
jgi:hypothetical protein